MEPVKTEEQQLNTSSVPETATPNALNPSLSGKSNVDAVDSEHTSQPKTSEASSGTDPTNPDALNSSSTATTADPNMLGSVMKESNGCKDSSANAEKPQSEHQQEVDSNAVLDDEDPEGGEESKSTPSATMPTNTPSFFLFSPTESALSPAWKSKAREELAQTVRVTFDIDALTPTQMRLILARISKTNPDVIASSFSHVIGLLSGMDVNNQATLGMPPLSHSPVSQSPDLALKSMLHDSKNQESAAHSSMETLSGKKRDYASTNNEGNEIGDKTEGTSAAPPPNQSNPIQYEIVVPQNIRQVSGPMGLQMSFSTKKQKRARSTNKTKPTTWEDRFQQLLNFKMTKGHLSLRRGSTEDPVLGQWCSNQRAFYNMLRNGKKPIKITEERIKKLENIGFPWSVA